MLIHNRPALTKQAFASLYGTLDDATVTILNDRSEGETAEYFLFLVGSCHKNNPNWHGVWNDKPLGTGPLRNLVVAKSEERFGRGDLLYLSDNDVCAISKDWLTVLAAAYAEARERGFRVLAAVNHPFHRPIDSVRLPCRWTVNEVYAVATQSMIMDWETWDAFSPFCDTPIDRVCQSEDTDFCNRIRAAGYKVGVISPALLVNTGITNSFGEHIPGWELVKSQCPEGIICE
jgi:hypothetical protein